MVLARGHCQPNNSWRDYNITHGFPQSAFSSVTVAESGTILAVAADSSQACLFDGYNVTALSLPKGAGRLYQSPSGQLWTSFANNLWSMKDQHWQAYPVPELSTGPFSDNFLLCPIRLNVVLCLLPERLLECNAEEAANFHVQTLHAGGSTQMGKFSSMAAGEDDELWIVGENGLARFSGPLRNLTASNEWREYIPPRSLHLQRLRHPQPDANGLTLVADSAENGKSVVVHFDGEQWEVIASSPAHLNFGWRGPDNTYWAASSDQLFHSVGADLVPESASAKRRYYDVSVDWRGTFWLATSAGLLRFTPALWQPAPDREKITAIVRSLGNGQWPNAVGDMARFDMDRTRAVAVIAEQEGSWLKPIGLLRDGRVCYATVPSQDSNPRNRLQTFEENHFQSLPTLLPQLAAASDLSCLLATKSGDLWIGGEFGTAWLHGRWTVFPTPEKDLSHGMSHLLELPNGQIWSASPEKIWGFDGKIWTLIRAGFNHLNAMICDRDGDVWVGDDSGVARFSKGQWIENGIEEGLSGGAILALCEDQRGRIWAASSNSVALYHPESDSEPPRTFILPMSEKEKNIPEDSIMTLQFGGHDKWDDTPVGRLLYSYRLDTGEWSPFSSTASVSFNDLPAGKHYFQARAMDRASNIDPDPAKLEFAVLLPWYKESRLVLIASGGAMVAGFFAILAYRRHRELVLSYAQVEKQVAERTRELEAASQELVQSQKMRALGTLAASIAHDFNNILSIIRGSAQIIEDNLENPLKIRKRADRIKTVVDQGSAVVQALLGFSRGSDETFEACEINAVVDNTLRLLGDRFLREVEVRFIPGENLPRVQASQSLIQQILLNFVFNAAESMDARKNIVITTSQTDKTPAGMALQPDKADAYVIVAVRDFGSGISAENLSRVFEPFFTTKALSTKRGTGLGLSIVYELTKKMGAGLAVESTVGEGSVFSLFLPVPD
jgi:signal transduction histidine kinase/ligand-binding sensor domain-containing protein